MKKQKIKLEEILSKEQLEKTKIVEEKADDIRLSIYKFYSGALGIQTALLQIVDEDAKSIIETVVDDAFFDYMNNIKED